MHKPAPMENKFKLILGKPLDPLNLNGLTFKIGRVVLCFVEEELKPCIENVIWDLRQKPLRVKEKLFWRENVILNLVLLMEKKKKVRKKRYQWKLEWKECPLDLRDMKPVLLKKEIWKLLEKILEIFLDLLEFLVELS